MKEFNQEIKIEVLVQGTPNPNALKFITEKTLKSEGKITIDDPQSCFLVPMAKALFELPGVIQIHFFENSVTVSKDPSTPWDYLEERIMEVIKTYGDDHDPNFTITTEKPRRQLEGELKTIDDILDNTIRPGLQSDGGDLEIVSYENKVLTVSYQGACTNCPSAISGTLMAIESILQDEFNPEIQVVAL